MLLQLEARWSGTSSDHDQGSMLTSVLCLNATLRVSHFSTDLDRFTAVLLYSPRLPLRSSLQASCKIGASSFFGHSAFHFI